MGNDMTKLSPLLTQLGIHQKPESALEAMLKRSYHALECLEMVHGLGEYR
jgi:hypothetical protein